MARRFLLVLATLAVTVIAADRVWPPDLSRFQERSLEVLDRDGQPLRRFTTSDGMLRLLTRPESVDPRYLALLLESEDQRFGWHPGVDPLALGRAAWQLMRSGHVVSGGSTLTMQVARLLEPHPHTVLGKFADIARALQLEARFNKHALLTMYLTLAPMGGNLEGVRAASLAYFGHEPRELLPAQAALLVAIPQSPKRLRPDRHAKAAGIASRRILARSMPDLRKDGGILPIATARRAPMLAPHLADWVRMRGAQDAVYTTIDGTLQRALEALASREKVWLGKEANVALLVVANRGRSVLAYVGGSDYFGPGGMVDMVRAKRSPGSTLKPFIYGLAFDDGIVAPSTVIDDAPVQLGDYRPQNFDRAFHGAVTVREALQQSYNSPAVQLIAEIGARRFAAQLRLAGAHLAFPEGQWSPDLPIALGGVGVELGDLAMLYAALADGGQATPLRFERDASAQPGVPLMAKSAARQVEEILRGVTPPNGLPPARLRSVAYKTGTSYGYRDALAIGFSGDYTAAVWVGRTEGTPRPGCYGRNTAAPLLFQIFDLLPLEAVAPVSEPEARAEPLQAAALQRFGQLSGFRVKAREAAPLQIVYPPAGARIELVRAQHAARPLALEATGGLPPYHWAVNGQPLAPTALGAPLSWSPDGPGFATVSVTDGLHQTTVAEIRLK